MPRKFAYQLKRRLDGAEDISIETEIYHMSNARYQLHIGLGYDQMALTVSQW
jgi:hypothetical protein